MIIRPPSATAGRIARNGSVRPLADWYVEWLENKGKYVLLECGHKDDLKNKAVVIGSDREVICPRCNEWKKVTKSLRFSEYLGIEIPPVPELPQF